MVMKRKNETRYTNYAKGDQWKRKLHTTLKLCPEKKEKFKKY